MTLRKLALVTGISLETLRSAARRLQLPMKDTARGPVYDLTSKQVKNLMSNLHGKRGRPKQ